MYIYNVLSYLENSAEKFADKTAFTDENVSLTFGELNRCAKSVGTYIANCLGEIRRPVAVVTSRSADCIAAYMGVLYSGCFYVPIDSAMPSERARLLLSSLSPALILYRESDASFVDTIGESEYTFLRLDDIANTNADETLLANIRESVLDIDPAYAIFTSGSTGVPKGIAISHRSVIDFAEWMSSEIGFSSDDVFANQAPFFFDLSVKDIYMTLKHGATDHIIPKKYFLFPSMLIDFMNDKKVTAISWATSAFNLVANSGVLLGKVPEHLKKVVLGGEALLSKNLNIWKRSLPNVEYINLYGPTEVTVDCTVYKVKNDFPDGVAVPIGKACRNMEVMLLDSDLNEVPDGTPGEICVRGIGLALGYINAPDKTSAAFVQNPKNTAYPDYIYRTGDIGVKDEDGNIVFKSRKDGQIKHMGYRIELGEVETALSGVNSVESAVCFYDDVNDRIICVYKSVDGIGKNDIVSELKKRLPKYMLPNIYVNKSEMPMTHGGKIDRVRLKKEYFDGLC